MRIVVTGASGLIGRPLIARLAKAHEVWALSRQPAPPAGPDVCWVTADLTREHLPADLPTRADAVVHLAQSQRFRDFPEEALDIFEVNVASTARLLDWARRTGVRHFVLASSGGLGTGASEQPYYLSSKHAAELLASSYRALFDVLALRFFFVYGREQHPTMLVPRLVEAVSAGRPVRLPGDAGPRLNPIHVSDAAAALAAALERRVSGVMDIAGPQVLTLREMCEEIGARLDRAPRFARVPEEPAANLVGDIAQMTERLGAPTRTFHDGVTDLLDKYIRSA
jgi:nucleoside-diphosphate-sugar epimerase